MHGHRHRAPHVHARHLAVALSCSSRCILLMPRADLVDAMQGRHALRMRMQLGWVAMVMLVGGCESAPINCHPGTRLMAKADFEGAWSYTTTIVEERDGVWVDVSTSEPLLVQARIDEDFIVFETITDPHPAQAFRIWSHGTIESDVVEWCGGTAFRETYDARPWSAHNGFTMGWSQGLVRPPSLRDRAGEVSPGFISSNEMWWPVELPLRDAAGESIRWSMPSNYFIATCNDAEACFSEVRVRHAFTRVTLP